MRSFENPEVIKTFMNWMLWTYIRITSTVFWLILMVCLVSFIICLVINTKSTKKITAKLNNFRLYFKQLYGSIKARFTKEKVVEISKIRFFKVKPYLRNCRYLLIWCLLTELSWALVRLMFWFIDKANIVLPWWCSDAEGMLLWKGSLYAFLFFVIAPMFITYCFGNKFVRNIWIFIYILWICLLFLRRFLALWCPAIEKIITKNK